MNRSHSPDPPSFRGAQPPQPVYDRGPRKKGSRLAEWTLFGVLGLMLLLGALALYNRFAPSLKKVPNRVAQGFAADRINILLIGVGGPSHPGQGGSLADAIMVLSLKPSTRQVAMISVPRDLYIKIPQNGLHRLNAAHAIGEDHGYPGGGPALLMQTVETVLGQPLHAYIRVDFLAFEKVIDELGGVDVYVYRPFYDSMLKDQFNAGWQRMWGRRALRYARARYVQDSAEGNNFARELRQQQVISALRANLRAMSPAQALHIVQAVRAVSHYTDTNLTTGQMLQLYSTFHDIDATGIRHASMAPFLDIFMVTNPADPGEAVRPRSGNFAELHAMANNIFTSSRPIVTPDEIPLSPPPPKPAVVPISRGLEDGRPTRY